LDRWRPDERGEGGWLWQARPHVRPAHHCASLLAGRAACADGGGQRVARRRWLRRLPPAPRVGFNLHSLHQAWDTAARENSPFDGVLGFSQGALTAAIFLAFLQQQHRSPPPYLSSISATSLRRPLGHHRRARRPDAPPPRFAILCGGFRRPWPAEAGGYWPPPQSSPLPTPCACTTLPRHLACPPGSTARADTHPRRTLRPVAQVSARHWRAGHGCGTVPLGGAAGGLCWPVRAPARPRRRAGGDGRPRCAVGRALLRKRGGSARGSRHMTLP